MSRVRESRLFNYTGIRISSEREIVMQIHFGSNKKTACKKASRMHIYTLVNDDAE